MRPHLFDTLFPRWLWRLPPGEKCIALTFDDGPDPNTTPALLEVLKELNLEATFFVVGARVTRSAALLKEAVADGHVLANHGYRHANHGVYPHRLLRSSIQETEEAMVASGLRPVRLFRPPYGIFRPSQAWELARMGYRGVMWTAHLRDWRPQSLELLDQRARRAFTDGSIILLHDGHLFRIQALLKILPRLVVEARKRGFRFVTLRGETPA